MSIYQIVADLLEWLTIFQQLHNENNHKKRQNIYQRVADRY